LKRAAATASAPSPSPATRQSTNVKALRATFAIKDGDWFNATLISKGLENLKKAYGQLGYINFGAIPKPVYDDQKKTVSLDIDIDEGKQFYVSRIEFQGNTITRDKVIRRELMLDEGSVYNSQLWEYSLLRLNQLEYFDPLKVDQDSEAHQDAEAGTVDLLLKVKEKGKNSIGLNGGVSGLSGAFLGVNYQTNNFLGLGETLSLQATWATSARSSCSAFTQPYMRNRPLNLGFQLFNNKQDYNAAKNYQTTTGAVGQPVRGAAVADAELQPGSDGLTFSVSYPLKRHAFQRVGMTYSLTKSTSRRSARPRRPSSRPSASAPAFRDRTRWRASSTARPRSATSTTPSTTRCARAPARNTRRLPGGRHWGNVRYISPLVAYKRFMPMHYLIPSPTGRNVLGMRAQLGYVQGFGGDVAPPNNRFYSGGEGDCAASTFAAPRPTATCPTRQRSSSPIPTAPAFRAIPPIRS
jgi:outer membrane protein insertion porin family